MATTEAYQAAREGYLWIDDYPDKSYPENGSGFAIGWGLGDGSGFSRSGLSAGQMDGSGHGIGRASGEGIGDDGTGGGMFPLCPQSGYGFGDGTGGGMGLR